MLRKPYLVFLGDATDTPTIKTAWGLADWCSDDVVGEYRLPGCTVSLGRSLMTPAEAVAAGAQSMVLGLATFGGRIPAHWTRALDEAVDAGLDIVSGMHDRLAAVPGLAARAGAIGVALHDVRHARGDFDVGTGRRRTGKRLLTVGTDCALGKKYTALVIAAALRAAGLPATFRATGQTGIMISGAGVAIDAVVADFIAGAAESLSPDNSPDHWDVIEGQGSLFHPAYAGVSLGLLHGSQPDAFVLCHDPSRTTITGYPNHPIPSLPDAIHRHVEAARLTNPDVECVGISLNTKGWDESARQSLMAKIAAEVALPVFDPMRDPITDLVDAIVARSRLAAVA